LIIILGIFFLLVGILFDDVITYVLIGKGFGVLENNLVYVYYGLVIFIVATWAGYIFIGYFWVMINNWYRKIYMTNGVGRQWADILVFLWCIIIMFIVINKVLLGWNHINIIFDSFEEEKHIQQQAIIQQVTEYKESHPEQYKVEMASSYTTSFMKISYFKMILVILASYWLFRVGYKVKPYGC